MKAKTTAWAKGEIATSAKANTAARAKEKPASRSVKQTRSTHHDPYSDNEQPQHHKEAANGQQHDTEPLHRGFGRKAYVRPHFAHAAILIHNRAPCTATWPNTSTEPQREGKRGLYVEDEHQHQYLFHHFDQCVSTVRTNVGLSFTSLKISLAKNLELRGKRLPET